jgi:Kef-type K+ transport system membrane component KefB
MENLIISISIIIGIAALFTIIAKLIRQPPIIAYLIAGLIVGPIFLNLINQSNSQFIEMFAKLGIALLLFIVGLNLDFRVLKEFGKVSVLAGISEILIMSSIGFAISLAYGFSYTPALYLAAAFAFSSTVVVVKILSDKKEMDTLHGKIALGILIVEDFVAALILMLIPILHNSGSGVILLSIGKIVGLIIGVFLLSTFIVNKATHYLARSQETLFLFGIAWALIISSAFYFSGLSLEIGALIAGMALASSKYHIELGSKIKPLRDFFVVLLFVYFGSKLTGNITLIIIYETLAFSCLILIGKPLIIMSLMKLLGYKKRTNFLTGSSLAQLSEFSLIIILVGFSYGHLSQDLMNVAILTSLITIAISSYSIHYSHTIFNKISNLLNIFEGKKEGIESSANKLENYEIILFGYHRIGFKILEKLKKMNKKVVVIDYNPKVILSLSEKGINCIYGDASDPGFLSEIKLGKAKLVISTIPDENANISIKRMLKEMDSKAIFIATAEQPREAVELYNNEIDYVIVPHHLGGDYISNIIEKFGTNKDLYDKLGKTHKKSLNSAKEESNFN